MSYTLIQNGDSGGSVRTTINDLLTDINNGSFGTSGSSGTSGQAGSSGTSGQAGSSGTSGQAGSSGTSGQAGSSGTSGTSGANGLDGSTVLSIGTGTQSIQTTDYFGTSARAGTFSIAIGVNAESISQSNKGSIAIGRNSKSVTVNVTNWAPIAIGDGSYAESGGLAIGPNATNNEGAAIGLLANAQGVAIGYAAAGGNVRGNALGFFAQAQSGSAFGWQALSSSTSVTFGENSYNRTGASVIIGSCHNINTVGSHNTLVSGGSYDFSDFNRIDSSVASTILGGRAGNRINTATSSMIISGSGVHISNQVALITIGNGISNVSSSSVWGTFSMSGTASFVALSNSGQNVDYGKNSTLISNTDVWVGGTSSNAPVFSGSTTRLVAISSPLFKMGTGTSNITLINSSDITVADSLTNTAVIGRNGMTASSSDTIYLPAVDATSFKVNGTSGWSGTFSVTEGVVTVTNGLITGLA